MSNSKEEYNTFIRANLPFYITYDSVRNQYVTQNGKRFVTYKEAKWYMDYIIKFGYQAVADYSAGGFQPPLVLDFDETYYRTEGTVTDLVSAATHTRASSATYVDANGVLQTAAINVPRVGHHLYNSAQSFIANVSNGVDPDEQITVDFNTTDDGDGTVSASGTVTGSTLTGTLTYTVYSVTDDGTTVTYGVRNGDLTLNTDGTWTYSGASWVNAGYFHGSEARTNLITYSEDFTDAYWSKANTDTLTIGATGPDGETSAVTLVDSGLGGSYIQVRVDRGVTVSASTTYTFSCFAKADQLDWVQLFPFAFTTPADGRTYFNLSTGSIGTVASGHTANIQDFGNGWYRCSITFTTDASDTFGQLAIQLAESDGGITVNRDGTSSILIYGAMFEVGSTPSSYIPTAGSTVTRAADTLAEVTPPWGSALSVNIKGTETFADEGSATQKLIYDRRVDAGNRITLALDTAGANTGKLTLTMVNGGTSATISTTADLTPNINEPFNVAFACTATELGIALNGTAETRVSHALGLPDLSAVVATFTGMGTRSLIREWGVDITDAGIAEAST